MYSRLAAMATMLFFAGAAVVSLRLLAVGGALTAQPAVHPFVAGFFARVSGLAPWQQALMILAQNLIPFLLSLLLLALLGLRVAPAWGWLEWLRYPVLGGGFGFAAVFFGFNAWVLGQVLAGVARAPSALVQWLSLGVLPHGLPEIAAFGLVIFAPWAILAGSLRGGGLAIVSYSVWVRARSVSAIALALLVSAALMEVYVTPQLLALLWGR